MASWRREGAGSYALVDEGGGRPVARVRRVERLVWRWSTAASHGIGRSFLEAAREAETSLHARPGWTDGDGCAWGGGFPDWEPVFDAAACREFFEGPDGWGGRD